MIVASPLRAVCCQNVACTSNHLAGKVNGCAVYRQRPVTCHVEVHVDKRRELVCGLIHLHSIDTACRCDAETCCACILGRDCPGDGTSDCVEVADVFATACISVVFDGVNRVAHPVCTCEVYRCFLCLENALCKGERRSSACNLEAVYVCTFHRLWVCSDVCYSQNNCVVACNKVYVAKVNCQVMVVASVLSAVCCQNVACTRNHLACKINGCAVYRQRPVACHVEVHVDKRRELVCGLIHLHSIDTACRNNAEIDCLCGIGRDCPGDGVSDCIEVADVFATACISVAFYRVRFLILPCFPVENLRLVVCCCIFCLVDCGLTFVGTCHNHTARQANKQHQEQGQYLFVFICHFLSPL